MTTPDSGLQPERTRLAWQRVTLTSIAALVVVTRLLLEVSGTLAVAVGVGAGLVLLAPAASTIRWHLHHARLTDVRHADGRAQVLVALIVTVAGLGAVGYVILA